MAEALDLVDTSGTLAGAELGCANLGHADLAGRDLSGANLRGANLSCADLRGAVLYEADLRGANLHGADLEDADLGEANARGTSFTSARLHGASFFGADLTDATLAQAEIVRTDLRAAKLERARLCQANLEQADLARASLRDADLSDARLSQASFREADLAGASVRGCTDYAKADFIHARVAQTDFCGAYLLRRFISDQNYLHEFRNRSWASATLYWVWWATSDCGRSVARWGLLTLLIAAIFSIIYTIVLIDFGTHATWLSPFYYSVVTLTTLGYGDALPASVGGQIAAMLEVSIGYIMLGGLLSIFATKMARRAD